MKRILLIASILFITTAVLFSTGAKEEAGDTPTKVSFWYLWGGTEGEHVEALIAKFNASQNKYVVEGLSVPDQQKIQVAIAAGDGPDVSDTFSSLTAAYAAKGILEPLDSYIKRDDYSIGDFMESAIESTTYEGKIYALPISVNLMMLFYNKDLLAEAGYTRPPETDVEMLEYAIKMTKTDKQGNITVLGFPDFPEVYYKEYMAYPLGGSFADSAGNLTPDNIGVRKAMELIKNYREKFTLDSVLAINSSGGYMSAADPFITGRQALRIDGPWFGDYIKKTLQMDLNYGVAPLPYPAGRPELARGGQVQTSTFFIPSNAKNKEGAWAFISWLHEPQQMAELSAKMGWIPVRLSALENPILKEVTDFQAFALQSKSNNLTIFPAFDGQQEYQKIISDAYDKVILLSSTIDQALAEAKKLTASLDY